MNIIFLDFYGVLNTINTNENEKEVDLTKNFKHILNETNSKVILLSSWHTLIDLKNNKEAEFRKIYGDFGFDTGTYLDYTPIFDGKDQEGIKFNILKYTTKRNKNVNLYNVEKIAIISSNILNDLELNSFMNIPIKFFKTNIKDGLTENISNDIICFLNRR